MYNSAHKSPLFRQILSIHPLASCQTAFRTVLRQNHPYPGAFKSWKPTARWASETPKPWKLFEHTMVQWYQVVYLYIYMYVHVYVYIIFIYMCIYIYTVHINMFWRCMMMMIHLLQSQGIYMLHVCRSYSSNILYSWLLLWGVLKSRALGHDHSARSWGDMSALQRARQQCTDVCVWDLSDWGWGGGDSTLRIP